MTQILWNGSIINLDIEPIFLVDGLLHLCIKINFSKSSRIVNSLTDLHSINLTFHLIEIWFIKYLVINRYIHYTYFYLIWQPEFMWTKNKKEQLKNIKSIKYLRTHIQQVINGRCYVTCANLWHSHFCFKMYQEH